LCNTIGAYANMVPSPVRQRDLRVDFFRGLALIFIFVDHIQENVLQYVTMQNFGFADAADVFVVLAGYASYLAYGKVFDREGWPVGLLKVGRRISVLYVAHILLLIVCVAALFLAALLTDNVVFQDVVNLDPFFDEPARAAREALTLSHQPSMLDILPLYVALLLWFPVLLLLTRIHVGVALATSALLWAGANVFGWNLPSYADNEGWYFNPFAWQLLFTLGAIAAHSAARQTLPRCSAPLALVALGMVLFALAVAAPWTALPGLDEARLLPATDDLLGEQSKQYLSLWRVAHLAALAYLASTLIPANAAWLYRPTARRVIECGQHSLPVFCLGIALSMVGHLAVAQYGDGWIIQIAINACGILLLLFVGWALERPSERRESARPPEAKAVGSQATHQLDPAKGVPTRQA
jgi:hypothetical protein